MVAIKGKEPACRMRAAPLPCAALLSRTKDLPKATESTPLRIHALDFPLWKSIVYSEKQTSGVYKCVNVYLFKETNMLPETWEHLFTLQKYRVHLRGASATCVHIFILLTIDSFPCWWLRWTHTLVHLWFKTVSLFSDIYIQSLITVTLLVINNLMPKTQQVKKMCFLPSWSM